MPSRLLAAALVCAAIFAALLGAGAMAQDPAPTADAASAPLDPAQTTAPAGDATAAAVGTPATDAPATTAAGTPATDAATTTDVAAAATSPGATTPADAAPADATASDAATADAAPSEATTADAASSVTTAADAGDTSTADGGAPADPANDADPAAADQGAAADAAPATDPAAAAATTDPAAATADPAAAAPAAATPSTPATATPAAPSTTATPVTSKPEVIGVTVKRPSNTSAPNTTSGVAGCTGKGRLIGVVGSSASTTASGCSRVQKAETPAEPASPTTPTPAEPTAPFQQPDGTPTPANPTYTPATPGPAAIGVPNFFIDKFRIPPFLLPIYQAAGIQYGVRWEVLAAINEIETDYGRNLNISSAGALGWMQFMPATWQQFGVDANRDGLKDPFNPVDAIFAAARYLNAAGAKDDLRRAIFAYNHADWYVDSVLMRARVIGGLPDDLVGSLTGLTQGRFPVAGKATYAQELTQSQRRTLQGHNAAYVVESNARRRGTRIYGRGRTPVVAANDGRIVRVGRSARLGRYVVLQDAYGNVYTYAQLGEVAATYPALRERRPSRRQIRRELGLTGQAAAPRAAASRTTRADARHIRERESRRRVVRTRAQLPAPATPATPPIRAVMAADKQRLFANPGRPNAGVFGGDEQLALIAADPLIVGGRKLDPKDYVRRPLKRGARVVAGTMLGRLARRTPGHAPHLRFEIRPAGRGAPRIDPKPILDGWKLLESTAIYRSAKRNPFFGTDAAKPSIGQVMLMGKEALERHVLANPRIQIYECGREDIRAGRIDRRVLATLEFLSASGLKPTVSSLLCGHGTYTSSGNVSQHSTGSAVDIAAVNGITISPATQGEGSITDITIQRLLTLQGTMKPDQIISLMTFAGTDNTLALSDHDDHIHVGWRPLFGANTRTARRIAAVLKPEQWIHLIERLGAIRNPEVREQPSKFSVKVVQPASPSHRTE